MFLRLSLLFPVELASIKWEMKEWGFPLETSSDQ